MPRPKKVVFPKVRTRAWDQQFIENYWLGLGDVSQIRTGNPFSGRTQHDIENPHVFVLDLLRQPEYFGFSGKYVFNKTLPPIQLAILRELWVRPFPMLIGSRGLGKCIAGNTLVHTSRGIHTIEGLARNAEVLTPVEHSGLEVLGENGFKAVAYAWNNGMTDTVRIGTRMGFELEGTANHPIRVVDGEQIVWKNLEDVREGDVVLIDRSEAWHEPNETLPDDLAYLLGLILGDGGYTVRGRISFTTADEELYRAVAELACRHWGKTFVPKSRKYEYELYSTAVWDKLFEEYGFTSWICADKAIPRSILTGSKSACAAFLRGLFDTDGGVEKAGICLAAKSEQLIREVQFVLTRFGIIAHRCSKWNKKYRRWYWYLAIRGRDAHVFAKKIGFGLTRKQEALAHLINRPTNTNRDFLPASLVLDDLLSISQGSRRKRGYGRRPQKYTASCLKRYGCTYQLLDGLLEETKKLGTGSWQRLQQFQERNWYFDTVSGVAEGRCVTYDVHVPEDHSFLSNGLVSHNSFILALYSMFRALFDQGRKIVIVGAAFRQAKVVFDYCQEIWDHAPVLRDLVGEDKWNGPRRDVDRCTLRMGESLIVALPMGDGTKIRGQRGSIIIAEEFASIPVDIFETVVRGFAAVSNNPIDKVQHEARKAAIRELGLWTPGQEAEESKLLGNQTIISGTAYYSFNHFYSYWKRYKGIVESRGDPHKLADLFGGPDRVDENLDWKDFSVIRIPVKQVPAGFMDEKQIAQAKATVHIGTYLMEYEACFATDSNGFFKRSLIEGCVVGKPGNLLYHASCGEVRFHASLRGDPRGTYVMGVDPASERDNFSIVILECWPDHRRIVHCWTTTRARYKAKLKAGLVKDGDFYSFVARKMRELHKLFPCSRIALDSQGGGISVLEALQDRERLAPGEDPFYPVEIPDDPQPSDGLPGKHLLEVIHFARADWVRDANHGLRKDFESRELLFPEFDTALLAMAIEEDKSLGRVTVDIEGEVEKLYDTLEDIVMEIEDLKDELATIVHTQTGTALRDHWDTPETKQAGGKKGRLRKDRYSALLMANMIARTLQRAPAEEEYRPRGGFAGALGRGALQHGALWIGPSWYTKGVNEAGPSYGVTVRRDLSD